MPIHVALLRAINVTGSGVLKMAELRRICAAAGFERVSTCIQSGNVVFASRLGKERIRMTLGAALAEAVGKPVGVHLRSAAELAALLRRNPFPAAPPERVLVHFLERAEPRGAFADLPTPGGEEIRPSGREVFVHYPAGIGRSRLRLPCAAHATARNLNTVRKLLEMARAAAG